MKLYTNVVNEQLTKEVQLETLKAIANALVKSFGPMGSNTAIFTENQLTTYTKDGHTILKRIAFNRPIEMSVKNDLEEMTRHIVKTVGDGTTSVILLASYIFEEFYKNNKFKDIPASNLVKLFKDAVDVITARIKEKSVEATPEFIRDIALISTNNNTKVADTLYDIYKEYGMDVFIDVNTANGVEDMLKIYDGMTIEAGYADSNFITNVSNSTAVVNSPNIYVFEDPIDTPEMIKFMDKIIHDNITAPLNDKTETMKVTPTVILASKISRDMSSYMDNLINYLAQIPASARPPLLLVTNITNKDQLFDIAKLSGGKMIQKYIDPEIQKEHIEKGLAPTLETIHSFAGKAQSVEANVSKTKVINPALKLDSNGEDSELFKSMISQLEHEIENARENAHDSLEVGRLRRRLNCLKANMVEYLVGGITVTDRDCTRDLVEDAVLNCRSAAHNGVGYGANYEAFRALNELSTEEPDNVMYATLLTAYYNLLKNLYSCVTTDETEFAGILSESIKSACPLNIRTDEFDGKVLSSIQSDIVILDTISKIVTLMLTCNQFICTNIAHNSYEQ